MDIAILTYQTKQNRSFRTFCCNHLLLYILYLSWLNTLSESTSKEKCSPPCTVYVFNYISLLLSVSLDLFDLQLKKQHQAKRVEFKMAVHVFV